MCSIIFQWFTCSQPACSFQQIEEVSCSSWRQKVHSSGFNEPLLFTVTFWRPPRGTSQYQLAPSGRITPGPWLCTWPVYLNILKILFHWGKVYLALDLPTGFRVLNRPKSFLFKSRVASLLSAYSPLLSESWTSSSPGQCHQGWPQPDDPQTVLSLQVRGPVDNKLQKPPELLTSNLVHKQATLPLQ